MSLRDLLEQYWERVRAHPAQEVFAGIGVAIGVGLVFAVLAANGAIASNARELVNGIGGSARVELAARGSGGFAAGVVEQVRALPGVKVASPTLEQRALVTGPHGQRSINLVGVDESITALGGSATRRLDSRAMVLLGGGVALPSSIAAAIGVPTNGLARHVTLELRGRAWQVGVGFVLGSETIGPIADAAVAVAQLQRVQALAGLPGRISRVLVTPQPGQEGQVVAGLRRIARGQITVAPVDSEVQLISQAAAPSYQATGLFAAIAAICGILLVVNAMLLTAPERRRSIAVLRAAAGYTPREIMRMVLFEAVVLGVLASIVGIAIGVLLVRTLFADPPSFLSFAFALSGKVAIPWTMAALVGAGGVLVTCAAAAPPLADLRPTRAVDAVEHEQGEAGQRVSRRARETMALLAVGLLVVTVVIALALAQATIVGIAAIAVAAALSIPVLSGGAARLAQWIVARTDWHSLDLAADGLRARTLRASALAAMGAVAICGCLAIEGAHRDVLRGLDRNFAEYLVTGDVWVTTGGTENSLTTESFPAVSAERRIRAVPGVAQVNPYYGGLLDVGNRRVWIIARGSHDQLPIPPSQLLHGDLDSATARVRSGGWIAVSNVLARNQHTGVGGRFTLPTPAGTRSYRVAAVTTNLGWGPGAVIMAASRYRRDWLGPDPSALEVNLQQGANPTTARQAIQTALGPGSALHAQTATERDAQFRALARDGLDPLTEIAYMLVIAAALSLAAGTVAAIWQRRVSLSALRLSGHLPAELWRLLILEAGIVLATGCLAGVAAGTLGHLLLARWLAQTTGYPAPFQLGPVQILTIAGAVLVAALALIAIASAKAANVDRTLALNE